MKKHRAIIIAIIFSSIMVAGAILFVSPYHALAQLQRPPADAGLVQCGRLGSGSSTAFCDLCDLIALIKNVLDYIWKGAWVLAAAMLIYGGFYMILPSFGAGGAGMYEKGKKILTNTAWGLVIIFFAWIVIDTIIKVVANQSLTSGTAASLPLGPWNKIECKRAPDRKLIALLEVPAELQCREDAATNIVGGLDNCDRAVQEAYRTNSSVGGARTGQCSANNIAGLNSPNSCGSRSCNSIIDEVVTDPNDRRLMRAIILIESGGNHNTPNSPAGACGIAQVLPSTARMSCEALRDPVAGIRAGYAYVNEIRRSDNYRRASAARSGSMADNNHLVMVGYNGGQRALARSNDCPAPAVQGDCGRNPGGYRETIRYYGNVEDCLSRL